MPGVGLGDLFYLAPGNWPLFSAAHQASHNRVSRATGLNRVIVDPLNVNDPYARRVFLLDHYRAHQLANAFFGTNGPDLSELDFDDPDDVRAWVDLNFTDHQTWERLIPPS